MKSNLDTIIFCILAIAAGYLVYTNVTKSQNREGFTYNQCRNQGYTKEFCGTNPWPGICRCPNGLVGRVLPGFMGECVCTLPAPQTYPPLEPPINRYYQNSYYF